MGGVRAYPILILFARRDPVADTLVTGLMLTLLRLLVRLGMLNPLSPAEEPGARSEPPATAAKDDGSSSITINLRAKIEADPDAEYRVFITVDDDVDIAALRRRNGDGGGALLEAKQIWTRKQAPILAAFRSKGLRFHDFWQASMLNGFGLTATGAVLLRMSTQEGVALIAESLPKKPLSRVRPSN